jgi:GAF domain-containing protein
MLVTPVKVGDQTIGVISADQDKFGWFSESDRRLVDALALQAGIAIQRAVGLELLQDIGNQIISLPRNVDEILQDIVHSAVKLTNTSTGVIYLISHDGRSVIKKFHPPDFDHPAPRMDRKDGLTRTAIATGEVLPIPDIRRDPRVNPTLCDRFQSLIAVPLRFEQRVIGVLYLNDEDSHDFTETEVSLLSTLANQAAIAVENARLYEQAQARLQERIDDIRALRDITALMRTAFLDDMLERIAEHAARLTPAKHAEVWLLDEQARELRFGAKNRLKEDTTQGLLALSLEEPSINARVALN